MAHLRADELCFNDTGKLGNTHPANVEENPNKGKSTKHHQHNPSSRFAVSQTAKGGLDVFLLGGLCDSAAIDTGGRWRCGSGKSGGAVDCRAEAGSAIATVEIVGAG